MPKNMSAQVMRLTPASARRSTPRHGRHTLCRSAGTFAGSAMEQVYGRFVDDGSEIHRPHADRVLGARLMGRTVHVQWVQGQHTVEVTMDLRNAMSLLTLLQAIHDDSQEPLPPEPTRVW